MALRLLERTQVFQYVAMQQNNLLLHGITLK
jgi:hypothetical protein